MSLVTCSVTPRINVGEGPGGVVQLTPEYLRLLSIPLVEVEIPGPLLAVPSFTINAEAGNEIDVDIQMTQGGDSLAEVMRFYAYMADSPTTLVLTASAPDATDPVGFYLTDTNGQVTITVGHAAGAGTWYLVIAVGPSLYVSSAITFA